MNVSKEDLARALLLAGARAKILRRSVWVELKEDGFRLVDTVPPRGSPVSLHVSTTGLVTEYPSGAAVGSVTDLLTTHERDDE